MELRNALSTSLDAPLLSKHNIYSIAAASQGSVILPSSPVNPNSSCDSIRSSLKKAVLRYARGTSNRLPSAEYTTQRPLPATDVDLQQDPLVSFAGIDSVSLFLARAAILCHFFAIRTSLFALIKAALISSFLGMIARRISQPAKRWQRMVALGKKHLTWETTKESDECCAPMAGKGHCVVYTTDGMRFEVPLAYLGKKVFEELLRMSHEEFGFTSDGQITLPCDAATMEYAICLLRRSVSEEVEKAFLSTMVVPHNYATCLAPSIGVSRQVTVCSF